jgi:predicted RecA/RadA family phage recombinase
MAKNIRFRPGDAVSIVATDPAIPASGDPLLMGQIPGVALKNEMADGTVSALLECVADLSVKAVTTAGAGSAVAAGDILYYVPANTPKISKAVGDAGAIRFGYALDALTISTIGTIRVKVGY